MHHGADGFSWRAVLPERTQTAMGSRKPLARIEFGRGLTSADEAMGDTERPDAMPDIAREAAEDGTVETVLVPVAVARALDSSDEPEPTCRAELLYRVRETADACAWAKLVDLASRREHASEEVRQRLVRDGYSRTCAERVVERGIASHIVSDKRFVDSFVRMKLASGWGPVRIERELSRRGIDTSELEGWPEAFLGESSPLERARELLARKRVPDKNAFPKLMRFLVSRGYQVSVAREAVSARLSEEADEGHGW